MNTVKYRYGWVAFEKQWVVEKFIDNKWQRCLAFHYEDSAKFYIYERLKEDEDKNKPTEWIEIEHTFNHS